MFTNLFKTRYSLDNLPWIDTDFLKGNACELKFLVKN